MFKERLIIVSGKGGVGKTAIASAVASAFARTEPTVLVSFDSGRDKHPFLGAAYGYEPIAAGPNLFLLRVDALSAIREYVRRKIPFSGLYDAFLKSRMFRDFAGAAPGFEELMCLGKLYDLVSTSAFRRVVFDAPATGHLKTLLDVPAATLEAVKVGPLNHNARKIQDLLLDPERSRVLLACLPEEMAVQEALELSSFCQDRRIAVGPYVVNQWVRKQFEDREIEAMRAIPDGSAALRLAVSCAVNEWQLAVSQRESVAPLAGARSVLIPRLVDPEPGRLLERMAGVLQKELPLG